MDLLKEKYIIIEIIPTSLKRSTGDIIELSALKLDGIKLIDRLNLRLNEDKVPNDSFKNIISYDKESFTYLDSTDAILEYFNKWSDNLNILILDNEYTINYLESLSNHKEPILKYLNMTYHDNVINDLISKYHLEPSNYIVDLLYESLINEL